MDWGTVELEPEVEAWLRGQAIRISYWIAPGRRVILMTVWRKTKMREATQVERARKALKRCQLERHTVDEEEL